MDPSGAAQAEDYLLREMKRLADDFARAPNRGLGSESRAHLIERGNRILGDYALAMDGGVFVHANDPDMVTKLSAARGGRPMSVSATTSAYRDDLTAIGDQVVLDRVAAAERATHLSVLPREPIDSAVAAAWLAVERRLEHPVANAIRARLTQTGWNWLFHVTRVERLATIGKYGLVDSGVVDLLKLDPADDGARRAHGSPDKQALLHHRVFLGFWPPWWLFTPNNYGAHDVAILAVDAGAVCLQPEALFSAGRLSAAAVSLDEIENMRAGSEGGRAAWDACWGDGPRPRPQAEVAVGRVHPAHISHVLFATAATLDAWGDALDDAFARNYPDLASARPEVRCEPLMQAEAPMGFPPSYLARA